MYDRGGLLLYCVLSWDDVRFGGDGEVLREREDWVCGEEVYGVIMVVRACWGLWGGFEDVVGRRGRKGGLIQ